jgi:uncharacterized protein DUF3592
VRGLVTGLILAVGLAVLLLALGQFQGVREARELMAGGSRAEGTITEQLGARKSNARYYSYRFRAGDREWVAARRDIPWAAGEIPVGTKVAVRYDPARPGRSITPAELDEIESLGNRLLFPLLGAGLLAWGMARIVRRRKPAAT